MSRSVHTLWPPLDIAYVDEFGQIDPAVYQTAGQLWNQAEQFVLSTLGDAPAGLRLMIKAVALVSRAQATRPERIHNLTAYLFQTYKHLVLSELRKERGHRQQLAKLQTEDLLAPSSDDIADLDKQILLEQLMQRMDAWTREVFELLVLGYNFAELGRHWNTSGDRIRKKFDKQVQCLIAQVKSEMGATEAQLRSLRR
jgi:DNA-directed RNA polymerase specialized sigma24 family protein